MLIKELDDLEIIPWGFVSPRPNPFAPIGKDHSRMPWNFHLGLRCGAAEGRRQKHHQKRGGLIVTSLRPVKNFFKKNHFGLRERSRATAARDGAESNSPVWERKIPSWRAKGAAPYTALCPLSSAARMADERAWRTSRMSSRECLWRGDGRRVSASLPSPKAVRRMQRVFTEAIFVAGERGRCPEALVGDGQRRASLDSSKDHGAQSQTFGDVPSEGRSTLGDRGQCVRESRRATSSSRR